jgi:hypothetical protein
MNVEFEKKLSELGFSYQSSPDSLYILRSSNKANVTLHVQLICSETVDEIKYGSHNGNVIESIGLFKFKLNPPESISDFTTFAFRNSMKHRIEFVIVPTDVFIHRLTKVNRTCNGNNKYKVVFWLMPDGSIYNCTNIGIEGEWYFMSKGEFGRVADRTERNYTEFLNDWDRLKKI